MHNIAQSGARVIVAVVLGSFFNVLLDEGQRLGIVGPGYVWVVTDSVMPEDVKKFSKNWTRDSEMISGFLEVVADPFANGQGEKFQDVWAEHEFDEIRIANPEERVIPASINAQPCSGFCGFMCPPPSCSSCPPLVLLSSSPL
eukprot:2240525-Rhodomonas_salina.1